MNCVVEISGHQYRVAAGDTIDVQKLPVKEGETVDLDKVLFVGGDSPQVGTPFVSGAKVVAKVVRQARDRKLIVFKRRPGLWQKKRGHRQHYTCLHISQITDGQGKTVKADNKKKDKE